MESNVTSKYRSYKFRSFSDVSSVVMFQTMGLRTFARKETEEALVPVVKQALSLPIDAKLLSLQVSPTAFYDQAKDTLNLYYQNILQPDIAKKCEAFVLFNNGTIVRISIEETLLQDRLMKLDEEDALKKTIDKYRFSFPFHRMPDDKDGFGAHRVMLNVARNLRWARKNEPYVYCAMVALIEDGYPLPGTAMSDRAVVTLIPYKEDKDDNDARDFFIFWPNREYVAIHTIIRMKSCYLQGIIEKRKAGKETGNDMGDPDIVFKKEIISLANKIGAEARQFDSLLVEPIALIEMKNMKDSAYNSLRWLPITELNTFPFEDKVKL